MVKEDNYIKVYQWMISSLGLKNNELFVFALIYGFCEDGRGQFDGSATYIAEATGSTRDGVMKILKKLTEKEYLIKVDLGKMAHKNGQIYKVNRKVINAKRNKPTETIIQYPKKEEKEVKTSYKKSSNKFNNFQQREYDFKEYEKRFFNQE